MLTDRFELDHRYHVTTNRAYNSDVPNTRAPINLSPQTDSLSTQQLKATKQSQAKNLSTNDKMTLFRGDGLEKTSRVSAQKSLKTNAQHNLDQATTSPDVSLTTLQTQYSVQ